MPREIETALVPVGTLEPHGILSLGTDNEIPARLAEAIAARLNALVAPTIPYGVTAHLGALRGDGHPRGAVHGVRRRGLHGADAPGVPEPSS